MTLVLHMILAQPRPDSLEALKEILRAAEPTKLAQFLWCLSLLGASNAAVQQSVARMVGVAGEMGLL